MAKRKKNQWSHKVQGNRIKILEMHLAQPNCSRPACPLGPENFNSVKVELSIFGLLVVVEYNINEWKESLQ